MKKFTMILPVVFALALGAFSSVGINHTEASPQYAAQMQKSDSAMMKKKNCPACEKEMATEGQVCDLSHGSACMVKK